MVHLQGPAEVLTILREIGRRQADHPGRIAECQRAAREQLTAQTELLRSIDRGRIGHHGHDRSTEASWLRHAPAV